MIDTTGVKMYVTPDEIWEFFNKNREKLIDSKVVVAENVDTKYAVLLTDAYDGVANLIVERDEVKIYSSYEWDPDKCYRSYRQMVGNYLLPVIEDDLKEPPAKREFSDYDIPDDLPPDVSIGPEEQIDDDELHDMEDAQYEREDELFLATADYLSVVMNVGDGDGCAIVDAYGVQFVNEVTDHFLQYLADEWGADIYRPTLFDGETGEQMMIEYPYRTE